jgi:hypothetical protein
MAPWYLFYKPDGEYTVLSAENQKLAKEILEFFTPHLINADCREFDHNPSELEAQLAIRFPIATIDQSLNLVIREYLNQDRELSPAGRARRAFAKIFGRPAKSGDGHVLYDIAQAAKEMS